MYSIPAVTLFNNKIDQKLTFLGCDENMMTGVFIVCTEISTYPQTAKSNVKIPL